MLDSHEENSFEWYINHHGHQYLRRTMWEHRGKCQYKSCTKQYTQSKLEDIMIEVKLQEVSQERPK